MVAASSQQSIFRYKTIKGFLHKVPVMLKFFLLLILSVVCMSLPPLQLTFGIIIALITAFFCRFTLREQLTDLKPAAIYAALMYVLSVFSGLVENWGELHLLDIAAFLPRPEFLRIALRLVLIVQVSAFFFRSTSAVEIREGLIFIEKFIRRQLSHLPFIGKKISLQSRFAENISLFLNFIPEIFYIWATSNMAWKARCGKQGFSKIKIIIFILISLTMEKAALKSKALSARAGN